MSEILVGQAYGLMQLRYEQFSQGVAVVDQQIQRLQALSKTPIAFQAQLGGAGSVGGGAAPAAPRAPASSASGAGGAAEYDRLVRATAALEAQQARLARAQGDTARAAQLEAQAQQRLTGILEAQETVTVQSIAVERQLTTVQTQAARAAESNSVAAQTSQQLTAMIGPAALATAAIGGLITVGNSFKEAFQFKAQLDQTTASIGVQLAGVRDSGQVFSQAARFANTYKLTQEETTDAIRASLPVIRQSQASTEDVLGTLARLRVLNPQQDFAGAARALAELKAGQVVSIVDRFNIARSAANAMKTEIEGGGDAVLVLSKYLDSAGVGMDALKTGASGASGALRDLAVAQEQLKIAQGEFAQGPGLVLLQAQTNVTRDAVKLLQGDVRGLNDVLKDSGVSAINPLLGALQSYNSYVLNAGKGALEWAGVISTSSPYVARLKDDTVELTSATQASADALSADAQKKLDSQIATAALSAQQQQLEADSARAAVGLLGAGDQALILAQKYGIATDQAQFLINQQQKLSNATALADQRKGEQTGTTQTAAEFNTFSDLARRGAEAAAAEKKKADDKAAAEAAQLQSARDNLALSRATTTAQKVAILRQQQARATTEAEKIQLQTQIEQAQKAGVGRVSAAQNTALQLNNVEQNSGLALAKTQRENLERLRDQQEDFDVKKARNQEDETRKIQGLLARGQRAAAAREKEDFARQQQRDQEDFDRARGRTLRNAAESTGDIGARTDLRTSQIGQRAALRGVRTAGGVDLGQAPPTLQGPAGAAAAAAPRQAATITIQGVVNIDGKAAGTAVWPTIEVLVDEELAVSLQQIGIPGSGQNAVGGVG